MKKLWFNCHIATMKNGRYSILENAAIMTENEYIAWIGLEVEAPNNVDQKYNLQGKWVTPGLIDCHTHSVFGGNRSIEFEQRLQGVSYAEIAKQGGGIASTVKATREATEQQLFDSALKRIQQLQKDGVTTIEIKSGYGLDLKNERKMLQVIRKLSAHISMNVVSTYLAAHALPQEYKDNSDAYIEEVCNVTLPQLFEEKLFDAIDGFCEYLAFSPEQIERIFKKAQTLNIPIKLHAEQLSSLGGSTLAAHYQALSADHLEYMTEEDVIAMSESDTVAVLLPGAFYLLRETQLPPIEKLIHHGVKIAISTDSNPGTSPVLSLRLMMNMACTLFRLTPEQALAGVTIHAAQALGMQNTHGSLEQGKCADFVAWDIEHPSELSYWLGGDIGKQVIHKGHLIDL